MNSEPVNTPEQLAEWISRYDNRSGFDLVSCQEVGLPVYKITVQALTQIRKEIPPIEEYVLKAIHAGLWSEQDIAGFLGLELPIVQDAMTSLRMSEDIDLIAPPGEIMQVWQVTKKGEKSLVDACKIVPEERTFTINFDGLLGKVRWYGRLEKRLLKARDLKNSGMIEIKPSSRKPPELSDITLTDVDEIVREAEKESNKTRNQGRDLLALKEIERRSRFFQKALALIYKAKDSDEVQVAFAIDKILSSEHETAFARADGPKRHRILETLRDSNPLRLAEEVLGYDFVDKAPVKEAERLKSEALDLQSRVDTAKTILDQTESQEEKQQLEQKIADLEHQIADIEKARASVNIRFLEMYEHRPLLEKALQESQEHLLIISPWITAKATNKNLINQLERLLQGGIQVFIGYGFGEDRSNKQSDNKAEKSLKKLSERYDNFSFKRLGDTHAKILICDRKFAVVGSFNWLSFKGDPNRTFRDERSTYISVPDKIDELFDHEIKRLID
jgi:hypothetical protein